MTAVATPIWRRAAWAASGIRFGLWRDFGLVAVVRWPASRRFLVNAGRDAVIAAVPLGR